MQNLKIMLAYHAGTGSKNIQMIQGLEMRITEIWREVKSGMKHRLRERAGLGAPPKGTAGRGKGSATKDH